MRQDGIWNPFRGQRNRPRRKRSATHEKETPFSFEFSHLIYVHCPAGGASKAAQKRFCLSDSRSKQGCYDHVTSCSTQESGAGPARKATATRAGGSPFAPKSKEGNQSRVKASWMDDSILSDWTWQRRQRRLQWEKWRKRQYRSHM